MTAKSCFDGIPAPEEDLRGDRSRRLVAVVYLAHERAIDVWKERQGSWWSSVKLTEKDKEFLERLKRLTESGDLWVDLKMGRPTYMALRGTYG